MTDIQLKLATKEILELGFRDNGEVIIYDEKMDMKKTLESIIPQLNNKDYFTTETKEVLAEMGWTREKAPAPDSPQSNAEPFEPDPVTVDKTLEQEIEFCDKIKDLKELARSEPVFKSIRGKLDSFDLDSLKLEMFRILNPEAYRKPEPEKTKVIDMPEPPDEVADIILPDESVFPDDFIEPIESTTESRELFGSGLINIKDIVRKEPFLSLFNINLVTLESIKANMTNNGYDFAFPVILWDNVLIDGFTRTRAAEEVGITDIPCEQKQFADEHEALEYAMHNQRDRRNITEAELLKCISVIDTPMSKTQAGAVRGEKKEATHKKTAKLLGIGESKVTDARTVLTDAQAVEDVKNAKKTMHEAAEEIRNRKRKPKETISEALSKVESVIQILKNNAGKSIKFASLLKESESLEVKEDVMGLIIEVLVAVDLIKINDDKLTIKKAIK
jgi:ParB family chromosome partitioning protein